jgi:sporulation protein YlmC with PRC-barrel domain
MIRNLLASTAIAGLLATGALAQDATTPAPAEPAATEMAPEALQPADGHLASAMIGEQVYSGAGDDAQTIGDVNDIVIGNDGMVQALVVGVGGFLGIAEKNVAIDFKKASWADQNGDRWLVVETSKEALQGLPDFDRAAYEPAPATAAADPTAPAAAPADNAMAPADTTTAPASTDNAMAPADTTTAPAPADNAMVPADPAAPADQNAATEPTDQTTTAAIDKSTLSPFDTSAVRSEDLVGTTVYGAEDANIGEIGDVVLSQDGKVDAVILDVGGFLGVGEKEVAVGMDKLSFMTDADGNKYLYTSFTKEQLDAQAAYDESTWADKRDEQRMMVQ